MKILRLRAVFNSVRNPLLLSIVLALPLQALAGSSLNFDGTQYVPVPASPSLTPTQVTFEAWVNIPAAGILTILSRGDGGGNSDYIFQLSNNGRGSGTKVSLYAAGAWDASTGSIPTGTWTDIAVTYDGTNKQFYINGVLSGVASRPGSLYQSGSDMFIGRQGVSCDCNYFVGQLAEVRVWNGVRTAEQIIGDMTFSSGGQPGLVAYYHLNEGSGTTASDASGNGHNGTVAGSAGWSSTGPPLVLTPGFGLQFSATNHVVVTPLPSLALSNRLTFEAWVRPQSLNCGTVLSRGDGGGTSDYILTASYDGKGNCGSGSIALYGANGWDASPPNVIQPSKWTHIAVTYDETNKVFYTNGIVAGSIPHTGPINQSGTPLYIGRQGSTCDCNFFQGQMDEIRIWNTARTPAQIKQDFNVSLSGAEPGLVAYYRFDEGSGLVAADSSGHGNNGALTTGMVWTASSAPFIAPFISNLSASNISLTSATLAGQVNPNNQPTGSWFDYGLSANYTNSTAPGVFNATNALLSVSATASLLPGQTYHFRLTATNSAGTMFSPDQLLIPPVRPPDISNQTIASLTPAGAVLSAAIAPNGADSTAWVQYGLTTNYGTTTATNFVSGTNTTPVPVNALLSGLIAGTAYHAKWLATNWLGATSGADQIIYTPLLLQLNTGFPLLSNGVAAVGDYDNDGRLDILISGSDTNGNPLTQIWRNTGGGFSNVTAFVAPDLTQVDYGSVAWGDYDNDGRLDILLMGTDTNGVDHTEIWRNTGSGFSNVTAFVAPGLPALDSGSAAWGDFDRDGKLDILLTGNCPAAGNVYITQVWRNTGSGFVATGLILPGVGAGASGWIDFDGDGQPDIFLSGEDNTGSSLSQLWRNDGHGGFTNVSIALPNLAYNSFGCADFNNDGLLDVVISGNYNYSTPFNSGSYDYTQVWTNSGSSFAKMADLPGLGSGSVSVADFDNDGLPDIIVAGTDNSGNAVTKLFRNTGGGFTDVTATLAGDIPNGAYTIGAWADFDNDGRLDLLLGGNGSLQIYHNMALATNSPPTTPAGLAANISGSSLLLNWGPSSDAQTPTAGLSYNLRIGTTPGGSDILAPNSGPSGLRRLPQLGPIHGQQFQLALPPYLPVRYYCSVQSVDGALAGSPFSPEVELLIPPSFSSWGRRYDGAFEAQFNVTGGVTYDVQASTDLLYWTDVLSFTFGSSGPFIFTDTSATNYPRRFYRLSGQ